MFDRKNRKLIRRIRWKAYHFCKDNPQPVNESANGYFEFKTSTTTTTPNNPHGMRRRSDVSFRSHIG